LKTSPEVGAQSPAADLHGDGLAVLVGDDPLLDVEHGPEAVWINGYSYNDDTPCPCQGYRRGADEVRQGGLGSETHLQVERLHLGRDGPSRRVSRKGC